VPKKDSIEKALQILKQAKKPDVEKVILNTKTTQPLKKDPLKDIAFINKVSKGEVKGLSKEALDAMQGVKTVKEAMQKAKSAGVEDEIRRVYPLEGSRFDLSKNKKGFLQVGKVDEAEAKLMEEARKYKSAEEFVKAQ
jgi:hypothetical protein